LGYGICRLRRADSRLAKPLCDLHVQLQQGAPIVVVLMIMYYVVFGNANIDAVIVAIIAFTLNFSAYASEIMRSSIEAVPPGQREAALALGYSESQAFHRFIFPQAAVSFLPVLIGQMIGLLKNTSIVGYIAIQDLTKMSDIVSCVQEIESLIKNEE
jgi:polar amino acid transport system substrate-binding protein